MKNESKPHHYIECGLTNVYVYGLHIEDDDGDAYVHIPAIGTLHLLISRSLLQMHRQLTGSEFYFLRGELGMDIKSVAAELKVSVAILEKWQQRDEIAHDINNAFRAFCNGTAHFGVQSLLNNTMVLAEQPLSRRSAADTEGIHINFKEKGYQIRAA